MIPIYVLTHPTHHWLLQGFSFLFNEFWNEPGQRVYVVTSGRDIPKLPENFGFIRTSDLSWTDDLFTLIAYTPHNYIILLLEDYWFTASAQISAIKEIYDWMKTNPELCESILRIDLSGDRASMKSAIKYPNIRGIEMVQTFPPVDYQMSIQAAIWNRDLLRRILVPGETAWQFEIDGTDRLNKRSDIEVIGTKHRFINYEAVWRGRKHEFRNLEKIPYIDAIKRRGWLDGGK
jgi:hypothetical protein